MNSFENFNSKDKSSSEVNIPDKEYSLSFVRSGGPGGQNVNKLNTKAVLKFKIDDSEVLSEEQKDKIKEYWKNRINECGELILTDESQRSQAQNKEGVIAKLQKFISEALEEDKERIKTKPSRGSKEKRLTEKKQRGQTKESRKKVIDY